MRRRRPSPASPSGDPARIAGLTLDASVAGGLLTCLGALAFAAVGRWTEALLVLLGGAALALGGATGRAAWPHDVRRARIALSVGAWGWLLLVGAALLADHAPAAVSATAVIGFSGVAARGITALWAVERAGP